MYRRILFIVLALAGLSPAQTLAAPSPQADLATALAGFQSFPVGSNTGLTSGEASARGKSYPLVTIKVSDVRGGSFTLIRRIMLYVPPALAERTYAFRLSGSVPGNLTYEVTQAAAAGAPAFVTHCRASRNGPGRVNMLIKCYRPEVEALGSLAQPSFTFTFKVDPTFGIGIGEGLDNIFTVETGSDFTPAF